MSNLDRPLTAFRSTMKFQGDFEVEDLSTLKYVLTKKNIRRMEMVYGTNETPD